MGKKICLVLFLIALALPMMNAKIYQLNENMEISHAVRLDGSPSSAVWCNLTMDDPDEIMILSFVPMVNNASTQRHEYSVPNINKTGEYCYELTCTDGTNNETEDFCGTVTPNGEEASTGSGVFYMGIYFVLIVFLILTIYGVVQFDNIYARFCLLQFIYLLVIAITFISWSMAGDFLTSAPFIISFFKILFWVVTIGFFPYVLSMMIWIGYSMLTMKEITDMMEHGLSMEEAEGRRKGKW